MVNFPTLLNNPNLYCINYGLTFKAGEYYCYDAGNVPPEMAYLVAKQPNASRDMWKDPVANAIWYLTGNPTHPGVDYQTILNEAQVASSIKPGGNISLTGSTNPVVENAEGKCGPFRVTYPTYNGKFIGDNLTITVNGRALATIPQSGVDFYLTEADGIVFGQENKIEVSYQGTSYSGTYGKFTPKFMLTNIKQCMGCGAIFMFQGEGFIVNGEPTENVNWIPDAGNKHNDECVGGPLRDQGVYKGEDLQDLIYIEPITNPINENKSITFWAGKPNIEIDIDKVDTSNKPVGGVTFDVTVQNGKTQDGTSSITTGNDGKSDITIIPDKGATEVKVILEETDAPANYIKYASPIELTYNWNQTSKQWLLVSITKPDNETIENTAIDTATRSPENCIDKFTIRAVNRPIIRVYIKKTDVNLDNIHADGNPLNNIRFDLDVTGGKINDEHEESKGVNGSTLITDASGEGVIIIEPDPGATRVTVTITEKESPYYVKNNPINISFTYDDRAGQWNTGNVVLDEDSLYQVKMQPESKCEVVIKNKAKINDLQLIKVNKSIAGEKIADITFRIILENARTSSGAQSIIKSTDSNGEINLGQLNVIDPSRDVVITLEEIGVPTSSNVNFKGLYPNGSVKIRVKYKETGCNVAVSGADADVADAIYDLESNTIEIQVQNEVTLNLSGLVWLDGQTGLKPVTGPNGIQDSSEISDPNKKMVGIKVVAYGSDGSTYETTTDYNGEYIFEDLPASINGRIQYIIEFTYDGINYIATARDAGAENVDSDVSEVGRNEFNDKFATIAKDTAIGRNNSSITDLKNDYTYDNTSATLQTMNGNTVKDKFAIKANTLNTMYNENTEHIDMGLVKKGVDLSAVTDIYSAKVTINGKEKIYSYNDIISLNDNITITEPKPAYNLYLYNSDYNYRIKDYSSLPVLTGTTHATLENGQYGTMLDRKKADGELNVELTYQVLLNNQSATDAVINKIAYYYDTGYVLAGATPELVTMNGKTYNKITIPVNRTFTDNDNQEIYNMTFTVGKDNMGALYTGEMKTWVEITSYSTNEGCIDADSAPDNIVTHHTEDDSDDARGLNIQVNIPDRTINGYVFEDIKSNIPGTYNTGNGLYDASTESKVSDVIVQLIEIKDITVGSATLRLEYIWQETRSGSNKVNYITNDGKNIATYNVSNQQGEYTFKDFIPGNYIVRFIYGDGTYYDVSTAEGQANILKYNGQDYKSTIDPYYDKEWYGSYASNASMARDNEARRLEEIAYATATEPSNLVIDRKDKLADTWMCSETSIVEIPVSDPAGQNVPITKGINFGLVKRPQASLELEKHVTALKIGDVVNSIADMHNYCNDDGLTVRFSSQTGTESVATAMATLKSPDNRGYWLVETQLADISGKEMSVTYSYRVRNIGDADYIGAILNDELISGKTYNEIAQTAKLEKAQQGYISGKYLGTAYYNGNTDGNVGVGIGVRIEDYLGTNGTNKLQLTPGQAFTSQGNSTEKVWVSSGTAGTENVEVIQSNTINVAAGNEFIVTQNVYVPHLDTTSGSKDYTFRSYAAQLIATDTMKTSKTGMPIAGATLGNLEYVQGYTRDILVADIVPEADEFIAETVTITLDTGGDKQTPVLLITAITGGLVVLAVGIVLIKKFVIK